MSGFLPISDVVALLGNMGDGGGRYGTKTGCRMVDRVTRPASVMAGSRVAESRKISDVRLKHFRDIWDADPTRQMKPIKP